MLLSLKNKGINLFFTDIDKLKKLMLSELKKDKIFSWQNENKILLLSCPWNTKDVDIIIYLINVSR